ncbi:MAG: glycosyltransferase family 4 protein [Gemmatimonadaceae bacterium]
MKVWLVHVGEPLPIDALNERQLRMSLFATTLAQLGHDVVWWSSTFDHTHKRQRFMKDTIVPVGNRLTLQLMHARPYMSNISLSRLVNHRQLAQAFVRISGQVDPGARPDVIFASMPTLELSAAATKYGRRLGIPVVVDVRDLHPDIYQSLVPGVVRPLARLALAPLYRDLRTSVRLATGLIAIAPSFLAWALRHAGRPVSATDAVFPLAYPDLVTSDHELREAANRLKAAGVRSDRKIVWYVGTFNRWIDLETPIRAARILAEQGRSDIQFVLSGSGGFDSDWRALAASLPNVVFTGWIDIPGIAHMRSIAWAGLAPYRPGFNTVGNKLFEYMAGGLPVLLSIGGDAKELIEKHDCGIAYAGADPDSLVDAVNQLGSEGVQRRMSANSLEAYRSHFSADKVYADMADFVLSFTKNQVANAR